MRIKVFPSHAHGTVKIPPSKSMAHRAIICACLASGRSVIRNISYSEDIRATMRAMTQLGASVFAEGDTLVINGTGGVRQGRAVGLLSGSDALKALSPETALMVDCNESGSTLRFLVPLFSLTGSKVTFTGAKRLFERPQKIYEEMFHRQRRTFSHSCDGITIEGKLSAGAYELEGNVSSQFVSGLLFTLPLVEGDSVITIKPPLESLSYIKLTLAMLSAFGIEIEVPDPLTYRIKGGQSYHPVDYTVEGDYSQFAFMAVLGALNGDICCTGMNIDSIQGDKAVVSVLDRAGIKIEPIENGFHIQKSAVNATDIDLADCPDLGPVLSVLAMYGNGTSRLYNAGRLRYKESDRIGAMEEELLKLGGCVKTTADEMYITGKGSSSEDHEDKLSSDTVVEGHNDHRIVMSLAVAAALCKYPIVINGAEAVNKSYPDFFADLAKLAVRIEYM